MLVPMELARIIISELNDQQVIYLREIDGERMFPILIGLFEATSIDRRIKKEFPQRPLTHDLLKATISAVGGVAEDVVEPSCNIRVDLKSDSSMTCAIMPSTRAWMSWDAEANAATQHLTRGRSP